MADPIEKNLEFKVDPSKTYYLTTFIGNGQVGNSSYTDFDGNQQYADKNAKLGKGDTLKDKWIKVTSEVEQVNPDKLGLIVTYYITDHEVDDPDDSSKVGDSTYNAQKNETIKFKTKLKFVS